MERGRVGGRKRVGGKGRRDWETALCPTSRSQVGMKNNSRGVVWDLALDPSWKYIPQHSFTNQTEQYCSQLSFLITDTHEYNIGNMDESSTSVIQEQTNNIEKYSVDISIQWYQPVICCYSPFHNCFISNFMFKIIVNKKQNTNKQKATSLTLTRPRDYAVQ